MLLALLSCTAAAAASRACSSSAECTLSCEVEGACCPQLCECTTPYTKAYVASGAMQRWRDANPECSQFPCMEARCAEEAPGTEWLGECVQGECAARRVALESGSESGFSGGVGGGVEEPPPPVGVARELREVRKVREVARAPQCVANFSDGTFWNHTKCDAATNSSCCQTLWSPQAPEECCAECQGGEFGFTCVAWEWYGAANACYICTKDVLPYKGRMEGHSTGCVTGLCSL
jgi:hypothetical protein